MQSVVSLAALLSLYREADGAPTLAAALHEHPAHASFELHLVWNDVYRQLVHEYGAIAKHVESLFDGTGLRIVWDTNGVCSSFRGATSHMRMIVRHTESASIGFPLGTMGASLGNSTPREAAFIFLPDILQTLDLPASPNRPRPLAESHLLARAVARVIAHEIFHAFVPEREHDAEGIMGLRLTRKQLTQPRLALSPEVASLLTLRLVTIRAGLPAPPNDTDRK